MGKDKFKNHKKLMQQQQNNHQETNKEKKKENHHHDKDKGATTNQNQSAENGIGWKFGGIGGEVGCICPFGCLVGKPILVNQVVGVRAGDSASAKEFVKVFCTNEETCPEIPFMHQVCFDNWERLLFKELRTRRITRDWNDDKVRRHLWLNDGGTYCFRGRKCKCGGFIGKVDPEDEQLPKPSEKAEKKAVQQQQQQPSKPKLPPLVVTSGPIRNTAGRRAASYASNDFLNKWSRSQRNTAPRGGEEQEQQRKHQQKAAEADHKGEEEEEETQVYIPQSLRKHHQKPNGPAAAASNSVDDLDEYVYHRPITTVLEDYWDSSANKTKKPSLFTYFDAPPPTSPFRKQPPPPPSSMYEWRGLFEEDKRSSSLLGSGPSNDDRFSSTSNIKNGGASGNSNNSAAAAGKENRRGMMMDDDDDDEEEDGFDEPTLIGEILDLLDSLGGQLDLDDPLISGIVGRASGRLVLAICDAGGLDQWLGSFSGFDVANGRIRLCQNVRMSPVRLHTTGVVVVQPQHQKNGAADSAFGVIECPSYGCTVYFDPDVLDQDEQDTRNHSATLRKGDIVTVEAIQAQPPIQGHKWSATRLTLIQRESHSSLVAALRQSCLDKGGPPVKQQQDQNNEEEPKLELFPTDPYPPPPGNFGPTAAITTDRKKQVLQEELEKRMKMMMATTKEDQLKEKEDSTLDEMVRRLTSDMMPVDDPTEESVYADALDMVQSWGFGGEGQ